MVQVAEHVSSLIGNLDAHAIVDVGTQGERAAVLHLASQSLDDAARSANKHLAAVITRGSVWEENSSYSTSRSAWMDTVSFIALTDTNALMSGGYSPAPRACYPALQESYLEQFSAEARPFAKAFAATQHFSVHCDDRLRGLELHSGTTGLLFNVKL